METPNFTIQDIRNWEPCYDPARHLTEDWSGTIADILRHETIPAKDKLWVVCREDLIDAKTLQLFAIWCAKQVEHLITDERSKKALEVAERFAHGQTTATELAAAWAAAKAVAGDAAKNVVLAAAWAAEAAAWAAEGDAWAAAGAAARDAQIKQLLKMIEGHDENT